jgi:hypothetical protein
MFVMRGLPPAAMLVFACMVFSCLSVVDVEGIPGS